MTVIKVNAIISFVVMRVDRTMDEQTTVMYEKKDNCAKYKI